MNLQLFLCKIILKRAIRFIDKNKELKIIFITFCGSLFSKDPSTFSIISVVIYAKISIAFILMKSPKDNNIDIFVSGQA
jgi:hypothetical protein